MMKMHEIIHNIHEYNPGIYDGCYCSTIIVPYYSKKGLDHMSDLYRWYFRGGYLVASSHKGGPPTATKQNGVTITPA